MSGKKTRHIKKHQTNLCHVIYNIETERYHAIGNGASVDVIDDLVKRVCEGEGVSINTGRHMLRNSNAVYTTIMG